MNQKGFAPVFIILIVIILCVGIVGGSYLVSETFPNLISSADQTNVQTSLDPSIQQATSSSQILTKNVFPVISGKNKLITLANGKNYSISDIDGKNVKELKEFFGPEYKSFQQLGSTIGNKQIIYMVSKTDFNEISRVSSSSSFSENFKFFIFDSQTEKAKEINSSSITKQFGDKAYYAPIGTGSDGDSFIFNVVVDMENLTNQEANIVIYKISTDEIITLTKINGVARNGYYDTGKKLLSLTVSEESGGKIRVIDISNQQSQDYSLGSVFNFNGIGNEMGPYYLKAEKYDDIKIKEMSIYPSFGSLPNATIRLTEPNQNFYHTVNWSPDYSVAEIFVQKKNNTKSINEYTSYQISYYTQSGRKLSSFDSEKNYDLNGKSVKLISGDGMNLPVGIFSSDSKFVYLYMVEKEYSDGSTGSAVPQEGKIQIKWQILDVQNGKVLTEPAVILSNRMPVLWY